MPISVSDIKYRKSQIVSDAVINGGRRGSVEVLSGVRHSLFPRVTKAQRLAGIVRYRKQFWSNENILNETAYGTLQWLEGQSNAGDSFYLAKGTQRDTQADLNPVVGTTGRATVFTGCGKLNTALSGGETEVKLDMEADDYYFSSGDLLHISNKFKTSQTIATGVSVGDSVLLAGSTWGKVSNTNNVTHPYGVFVGDNTVFTIEGTTKEEWLEIKTIPIVDEVIGVGNGSSPIPALDSLLNPGILQKEGFLPVITTVNASSVAMTAYIRLDGSVSTTVGQALSGQLNMQTGAWTTAITWSAPVKNLEDILVSYHQVPFSYSGDTVTIELDTQVSEAYLVANTYASGCVHSDEVKSSFDNWVKTSPNGLYDETTYPVIVNHDGSEEDDITVTMLTASTFSVAGTFLGSLGSFSVASDCIPNHPITGKPLFTLASAGWSGTWAVGNKIQFSIHPACQGIWIKEVVPASTLPEPNNMVMLGWYTE